MTIHADIRVRGQVQGVGFRPFVYRLAQERGLSGWVRNDGAGVEIALEGAESAVLDLLDRLRGEPPRLARVESVDWSFGQLTGAQGFHIETSGGGRVSTGSAPDMALCPDCLAELFDPADRRYRYPFINCIQCGPRYSLTARLPYDRPHTSMAAFTQCPACQAEYDAPNDRRFHAQPNACPDCGPRLSLFDADWAPVAGDPLAETVARLRAGQVVAIKGVGGFHLVCDARNADTLARLRAAKQRASKPFALMALNAASAAQWIAPDAVESALLTSAERPIVLAARRAPESLPGIAPGLGRLGVMLPYAPLHWLIFHEWLGRPAGTDWLEASNDALLVMTSANPGGEPLARDDAEARAVLGGMADAYLSHDRGILHRCDDSVMQAMEGAPAFVRRARGHAPAAIKLAQGGAPGLACGAHLKNTLCVLRGRDAILSPHLGDLDHPGTRQVLEDTVQHLLELLQVRPQWVAHDLHPDYYSSQFAVRLAAQLGVPTLAVQHHRAHIAAVCAEHGVDEPVLGLALDGVGLGDDGAAWGGELLRVDGARFERLGHLAPLPLPGGDRAAREPWRMAAALLHRLGRGNEIVARYADQPGASQLALLLERDLNAPLTSSAGRWFDAAAGLLGVCAVQGYEGEAAMRLQTLAEKHGAVEPMQNGWRAGAQLDLSPVLAQLADCRDAGYGAALFHATLSAALADWLWQAAHAQQLDTVALSGGCLLNRMLAERLGARLRNHGLRVLLPRRVPPNDGGIALGQAWVARKHFEEND